MRAATKEPLLVIVDDLQWVDRASALVLGFVARRLHGTRVRSAALAPGTQSFFQRSGLRGHDLDPLDDAASMALLVSRLPGAGPSGTSASSGRSAGRPARPLGTSSRGRQAGTVPPGCWRRRLCPSANASRRCSRRESPDCRFLLVTCFSWRFSRERAIWRFSSQLRGNRSWKGCGQQSERGWCVSIVTGD